MAGLLETLLWEESIYQWETDDPVIGGPNGLDNLPTRQLANRTGFLKKRITDHELASDPHPQYLTQVEGGLLFDSVNAATNAITSHTSSTDPHGAYFNQTRGDARYSRADHAHTGVYEPAGAVAAHAGATDPHPQYLNQTEGDARYELSGAGSTGLTAHIAAADPHPQYLTPVEANAAYAGLGHGHNGVYEPAGAISAHTAAADPHPQYQTQAENDARYALASHGHAGVYDPSGTAAAAMSTHTAAADPHPQYLNQTEGDGRYALAHTHPYEPTGAVASGISTHNAAGDPHPQYLKKPAAGAWVQKLYLSTIAMTGTDYFDFSTPYGFGIYKLIYNGVVSYINLKAGAGTAYADVVLADPTVVSTVMNANTFEVISTVVIPESVNGIYTAEAGEFYIYKWTLS